MIKTKWPTFELAYITYCLQIVIEICVTFGQNELSFGITYPLRFKMSDPRVCASKRFNFSIKNWAKKTGSNPEPGLADVKIWPSVATKINFTPLKPVASVNRLETLRCLWKNYFFRKFYIDNYATSIVTNHWYVATNT